ncbi:MAG: T9SS type A sorting domain-containing protein, partial [Flavisolibacter sp.]
TSYYFTFKLATPLLANTNFKISLTMTLANGDKAVTAYTLATNAQKVTAKAPLPLPVKFSSFVANKVYDAIDLTWTVGTEENVAGYEVQKSTDGNTFTKIGFVAATGRSSYSYVDSKVSATAFYRIRSVDIDSKYIYSSILSLKGDQSDVIMKAFPSPVQSQLTVQHSSASGNSKIDVLSVDGRLVKSVLLAAGSQQTSVDLSSAKAGIYVIRLVNGNTIQSIKVTKQ